MTLTRDGAKRITSRAIEIAEYTAQTSQAIGDTVRIVKSLTTESLRKILEDENEGVVMFNDGGMTAIVMSSEHFQEILSGNEPESIASDFEELEMVKRGDKYYFNIVSTKFSDDFDFEVKIVSKTEDCVSAKIEISLCESMGNPESLKFDINIDERGILTCKGPAKGSELDIYNNKDGIGDEYIEFYTKLLSNRDSKIKVFYIFLHMLKHGFFNDQLKKMLFLDGE